MDNRNEPPKRLLESSLKVVGMPAPERPIAERLRELSALPKMVIALESSGRIVPAYWKNKFNDVPDSTIALLDSAFMLKKANELFQATNVAEYIGVGKDGAGLTHTGFKVIRVQRVENLPLWQRYSQYRNRVANSCPSNTAVLTDGVLSHSSLIPDANEKYLFHGTSKEGAALIAKNGFETRNIARNGMFGKGS